MILLLLACAFDNDPPRVLSVNGVLVKHPFGIAIITDTIPFTPGETLDMSVEARDPEGQPFELWWPEAPPGFSFDKDETTGTWDVPDDFTELYWSATVIAMDTAAEPAGEAVRFAFVRDGFDVGDTGRRFGGP